MIFTKNYTDDELISAIKEGGKEMELAMRWLYHRSSLRREVQGHLAKLGAQRDETDDVWQDGICAMILNIRSGKFRQDAKVSTFLHSICKNIWLNKTKRRTKWQEIKGNIAVTPVDKETPESLLVNDEEKKRLADHLGLLGAKCKKILELWSLYYSMDEIADLMGYKSSGMARKKKHQCLQRLMRIVNSKRKIKRS